MIHAKNIRPRACTTTSLLLAALFAFACDGDERTESSSGTAEMKEGEDAGEDDDDGQEDAPCSVIVDPMACNLAVDRDQIPECRWVTVATAQRTATGCTYSHRHGVCVAATNHEENGCTPQSAPFTSCASGTLQDAYRVDDEGAVTLLALPCGPEILNWTQCWANPADDPPECECRCLDDRSSGNIL